MYICMLIRRPPPWPQLAAAPRSLARPARRGWCDAQSNNIIPHNNISYYNIMHYNILLYIML